MSLPDRLAEQPKEIKSASIYSIVNAQAGGVASAVMSALFGTKLDDYKSVIIDDLKRYSAITTIAKALNISSSTSSLYSLVYSNLVNDGRYLLDAWKAGVGLESGTALMSLIESYSGYPNLLRSFVGGYMEEGILPWMERHWRAEFRPSIPNSRMAFQMVMEGKLSRAEFNSVCKWEGWSDTYFDKLYAVYDRDPSETMAFSMFKRGIISKDTMFRCFKIRGYDDGWHNQVYLALHRRPSYRELMTLSDYVPLDALWVAEVLRAQGYLDTDILKIVPAIEMRPLREEVRSVAGRYCWERQIGRLSSADFKASLEKLGLLPKEITLWLLWGDLRYADELIDEQTEIIKKRVEKGDPDLVKATKEETMTAIKAELTNIGWNEEKSNLMAEFWYWSYVF